MLTDSVVTVFAAGNGLTLQSNVYAIMRRGALRSIIKWWFLIRIFLKCDQIVLFQMQSSKQRLGQNIQVMFDMYQGYVFSGMHMPWSCYKSSSDLWHDLGICIPLKNVTCIGSGGHCYICHICYSSV